MSIFRQLIRFLERLFGNSRAERERKTLEQDTGKHTIEVSLYQSKKLTEKRGRAPEQVAAKFIAQAISHAEFDYKIDYGYEEVYDPPSENNSVESFSWWAEEASPENADNSNVLLYDSRGGGRAAIGGKNAIAGANRIKRDVPVSTVCSTPICDNAWPIIHEIGHNLGGKHSTPMMTPKPEILFHKNMVELLNEREETGELE